MAITLQVKLQTAGAGSAMASLGAQVNRTFTQMRGQAAQVQRAFQQAFGTGIQGQIKAAFHVIGQQSNVFGMMARGLTTVGGVAGSVGNTIRGTLSSALSRLGSLASSVVSGLVSGFSSLIGIITSLVGTVFKVGLGIGAIGVALAALEVKNATKEFVSFEKAIVDAASKLSIVQAGLTFEEAKKSLGDLARTVGRETIFTAEEAAQALSALVQTGLQEKEIFDVINPVIKFAAANHLELSEAALDAVLITRSFNMEMSESGRVMDVLTAAAIKSTATVDLMREAMKFGSRSFAVLGFNVEETASAIAIIAKTMRTGSISGTTFSQAMVNIAKVFDETKKKTQVREDLKKLGVDFTLLEKAFSGAIPPGQKMAALVAALEPLANATQESVQNFSLAVELLQIRGSGILPLLREGAISFEEFQAAITNTNSNTLNYNRTMGTTFAKIKLLESAWSSLRIDLVQAFAPALGRVLGLFTDLVAVMGPMGELIGDQIAGGLEKIAKNFKILEPIIVNAAGLFGGLIDVAKLMPSILGAAFFFFKTIATVILPFVIDGFAMLARGLSEFIAFIRDLIISLLESEVALKLFGLSQEEAAEKIKTLRALTFPLISTFRMMGNAAERNKDAMMDWMKNLGTGEDSMDGFIRKMNELKDQAEKGLPTGRAFAAAAGELGPGMEKIAQERAATAEQAATLNLLELRKELETFGLVADVVFKSLGDLSKDPAGVEQALTAVRQLKKELEETRVFEQAAGSVKVFGEVTRKVLTETRRPSFAEIQRGPGLPMERVLVPGKFEWIDKAVLDEMTVQLKEKMEETVVNVKEFQRRMLEETGTTLEEAIAKGSEGLEETVRISVRKAFEKNKKANESSITAEIQAETGE